MLPLAFLFPKNINPLNKFVVKQVIELRQNHKIKTPDAIIAATALVHDLILISRNVSDFKTIYGLQTVNPHNL
ncbi:MAG: PIN domain-containing protein [Janthinobacterium lividum]